MLLDFHLLAPWYQYFWLCLVYAIHTNYTSLHTESVTPEGNDYVRLDQHTELIVSPKDRRPHSDGAQLPSVLQSQDRTNAAGSSKAMRNSETASSPAQDHNQQRSGSNSALTEEVSHVQHRVCAESYHHSWQLPRMLVFKLGCGYNACPSAILSQSTAT